MAPLFLDIETIPDESRSSLWGLPKLEELPPVDDLLGGTVDSCKKFLNQYAAVIPVDYLTEMEVREMSASGKRRGSLLDALIEAREAGTKLVSEMSFDPDTLRIIAIGYAVEYDTPVTLTLNNCSEAEMLQHVWMAMEVHKPWVTYNGLRFDIPAIVARSMLLGVKPTCKVDWRRYGNSQQVDLMEVLSLGGLRKWKGLKKVAPLYGIDVPVTEVDGSNVFSLYQANDWETISRYLAGDIVMTRALFKKVQGYFL
jgi:DNA polymerase elongation subunit (family B)